MQYVDLSIPWYDTIKMLRRRSYYHYCYVQFFWWGKWVNIGAMRRIHVWMVTFFDSSILVLKQVGYERYYFIEQRIW
jgi:hypothetical protein